MKNDNIVKPIKAPSNKMPIIITAGIIVILVGLVIGFLVSSKKSTSMNTGTKNSIVGVTATEAGVKDPSTIKGVTTATGTLKTGGIKGEGQYHLDRPGGPTQTVYLTSTTIDITPFVDKKVQVWGQTLASQNAPWRSEERRVGKECR